MIERIIEYSVRNRVIVIILSLVVVAIGVHALINTPVDAIPDLSENQVIVFADWPGRSPREVEDQVTYPLSVNLQGLAGIKAVRATSEFGFSMINLIFEDNVDFYFARERVLERLSIANTFLPPDVAPYMAPDATALGQIFWYTVEGQGYDLGRLRAIQDWFVRYQLYSVPGVAEVASVGGYPIEYQIDVDPVKLRAYGVTLGQLYDAVARSNSSVGGRVVQKANAEYLVRSVGWIRSLDDVRRTVVKQVGGTPVYVENVANVQFGSGYRRAALEKDGRETVGGVVLMRYGENPLAVTQRIKEKLEQLQSGLPPGVRVVPFYERTRLIHDALDTLQHTLIEEMIVASLAVLLILWHFRSALVICVTLPLAVLISFICMRYLGVPSNIMSLSGIAISIGVLVDSSIVMVENATHHLHEHFGSRPVEGDTESIVLPALKTVGRPIFFSVAIMVISFIPVFSLGGMEGRMFHPLAFTKTFAMVGVAILSITLVPALVPLMVRGRLRGEQESWIVRSFIDIYRPVLSFLLDHPWPIFLTTSIIFIVGLTPVGIHWLLLLILVLTSAATLWAVTMRDEEAFARHWLAMLVYLALLAVVASLFVPLERLLMGHWQPDDAAWAMPLGRLLTAGVVAVVAAALLALPVRLLGAARMLGRSTLLATLVLVALLADHHMTPLGREFVPPLDEGSALDMPVTVPRVSMTQATDDLMARDKLLRMFPEVELVVGKAGRAETPTDPSPPDMIETVINLRPRQFWPKRKLNYDDALAQTRAALRAIEAREWAKPFDDKDQRQNLINTVTMAAMTEFDRAMAAYALKQYLEFEHTLAPEQTRFAVAETIRQFAAANRLTQEPDAAAIAALANQLTPKYGEALACSPDQIVVRGLAEAVAAELERTGAMKPQREQFVLPSNGLRDAVQSIGAVLGMPEPTFFSVLFDAVEEHRRQQWAARVHQINWNIFDRGVGVYTDAAVSSLIAGLQQEGRLQHPPTDEEIAATVKPLRDSFAASGLLWQKSKNDLLKEIDTVVQVPGWANIWTQPIINRVDMLATGVRTMIGVKVYGDNLETIQKVSDEVADVLKQVPGAVDVFPDQIIGEGYLEITIDRQRAARYGISVGDIQDVIETALGGKTITMTVEDRERFPVRVRYARDFREDEEQVRNLLIGAVASMPAAPAGAAGLDAPTGAATAGMGGAADSGGAAGMGSAPPSSSMGRSGASGSAGGMGGGMGGGSAAPVNNLATTAAAPMMQIPLSEVAEVRIVEGPSMIKSENGLLRSYVQLNVRDRDIVGFVEEAKQAVERKVALPRGVYLEWSGQFEHQQRARRTLQVIFPIVMLSIFVILYVTYHDLADALLMLFAVCGAVSGGVFFQWLFGFNFSVAVWVGFIACFGLATSTGIVMFVYLREAVDRAGGLRNISMPQLRQAVIEGAVHRLRPKLLTEGTTIIALAPMLWATGTGAEIMRPMAAPVLGGILVADEVIDLLLPVLFFQVRAWRWRRSRESAAERRGPSAAGDGEMVGGGKTSPEGANPAYAAVAAAEPGAA